MTLHQTKGLEFKVVFIVGVEERLCFFTLERYMINRRWKERRLLYVGVTRAQKKLYLVYSANFCLVVELIMKFQIC